MEFVKVRALVDVTIVLPAGEEAMVRADHARHVAGLNMLEIVQDARQAPSETKPATPLETKPVKPSATRKGR